MKDTKLLFAIGQGALVIAVAINRFFEKNMVVVFLLGLFTMVSIIANIKFLVNLGREIKAKRQKDNE
jgi:hypothetical protein